MTIGELLVKEMPGSVNKEGKIFSSMIANARQTGAVEKEMKLWEQFAKYYVNTSNIYKQDGELLDKTVEFFSYLKRFFNETDKGLIKRFKSILYRNGNITWGTPFDIKSIFDSYFTGKVYLLECVNSLEENLIENGDFDDDTDGWELSGSSEMIADARFSKSYGISLGSNGTIKQSVTLDAGYVYFIHWFITGKCAAIIHNKTDNTYWNYTNKTWNNGLVENLFQAENWNNQELYFNLKDFEGEKEIEITFKGIGSGINYIDFILLFKKEPINSFMVIVQNEGDVVEGALALAEGTIDNPAENIPPNVEVKAENWGYYNNTYLTGPVSGYSVDIYNELLDYVRSVGYKAYLKFVTKDLMA